MQILVYQAQILSCKTQISLVIISYSLYPISTHQGIPRTSAETDSVVADTKTADTVLVAAQRADLLSTQNIPNLSQIVS